MADTDQSLGALRHAMTAAQAAPARAPRGPAPAWVDALCLACDRRGLTRHAGRPGAARLACHACGWSGYPRTDA